MIKFHIRCLIFCGLLCLAGLPAIASAGENTLTLALESDPTNIDPRLGTDVNSARVYQIVCNGLVRKDPQANLLPDLAERWDNPDDQTYTFYLRKGVKFHDGTELTSEDVQYTFESILNPALNSSKAAAYKNIRQIEILDPYTIKFTLVEPSAPFLLDMTQQIVPKKASEKQEDQKFTNHLIGTGPFKFVEWKRDEQVVFEANPDYFEGVPKVKRLIFKIIPDDTVRFLELQQGTVDLVQNAIPLDMIPVAENLPDLKVVAQDSVVITYLGFNLEDPILQNVKVRQAMAYAINRQAIVDNLLKGQAALATGLISRANWAYEPDVHTYPYDPEKAKTLLDEAGYPDPDGDGPEPRLTIVYKTSVNPERIRIGEVLQDQLKQVGIEVSEIQTFEWAKFYDDIKSGNFQIFTLQWVGITEPDMFYSVYHSKMMPPDGKNRGRYVNPRIDELTEKARVVLNIQERKHLYSEVQKILAEELPYVYLWYPYNIVVMNKRVQGFTLYSDGDFASLKDVWIEE